MKGNALIKFFLVVFILFSAFQLMLMVPTWQIEQKAMTVASLQASEHPIEVQQEQFKIYYQNYLDEVANEIVFTIPYVVDYTYQSMKSQQLQLGLDLQGGMQMTLSIDSESFLKDLSQLKDETKFAEALANTNKETALSHPEYIDAFFDYYQKLEMDEKIIQQFIHHPSLKEKAASISSVKDLKQSIQHVSKDVVQKTRYLLNQRVNELGLAQAHIMEDLDRQNIQVELPSVSDANRIRKLMTDRASLEFWNVYRVTDAGILEGLVAADRALIGE